jgi:hypothetical protein
MFKVQIDLLSAQNSIPTTTSIIDMVEQTVDYAHTKYILAVESKLRSLLVALN